MVAKRKTAAAYIPDRGDIIWLDFAPSRGREQDGSRPAVVVSPAIYNKASDLALVVPVTSHAKGYPFEVSLPRGAVSGVVLSDQIRSVAWRERRPRLIGRMPPTQMEEIEQKLMRLIRA